MTITREEQEKAFEELSPWAHYIADCVHYRVGSPPGIRAEFRQVADVGLWEALCRADCPIKSRIKAFSFYYIKGAILRQMRFEFGCPIRHKDIAKKSVISFSAIFRYSERDESEYAMHPDRTDKILEYIRTVTSSESFTPTERRIVDLIIDDEGDSAIVGILGVTITEVQKAKKRLQFHVRKEFF